MFKERCFRKCVDHTDWASTKNLSCLTIMPSQTQKQLMAELVNAGLDNNELDVIRDELKMDLEADQDESDDLEMLDSDDDCNHSIATSSTVRDSLPPTTS